MVKAYFFAVGLAAAGLLPMTALGSSIVTNGGFESDGNPPTGWSETGTGYSTVTSSYVHSGIYGFSMDGSGTSGTLSQTLTTVMGDEYSISFWLKVVGASSGTNEVKPLFGGTQFGDITVAAPTTTDWTQYTYTATATSTSTVLEFDWTVAGSLGRMGLDDVSVTDQSLGGAVPLPSASWAGFSCLGLLGGLALLRRRGRGRMPA